MKGNQLEMQPEAAESLERVLLCAARVMKLTSGTLSAVYGVCTQINTASGAGAIAA